MTEAEFDALIDQHMAPIDRRMATVVGYYLVWYALAEQRITAILAKLTDSRDLERFEIITKGMDGRVKLHRLLQLAKLGAGIGPKLKNRLEYFESVHVDRRNKLVHSTLRQQGAKHGSYQMLSFTVGQKSGFDFDKLDELPPDITASVLLEDALWLRRFGADLGQAFDSLGRGPVLEIESPQTTVPKEDPTKQQLPKSRAKPRKPQLERP